MKRMLAFMAFLSMFGLGVEAAQRDKPVAGQVCTLKVEGMACSACAAKVEKTALKIEGVKAAKVNQPKGITAETQNTIRDE
jgi:hypothetical protein